MKKICTLLLLILLCSLQTWSQQLPLDFSTSNQAFSAFSGSQFSFNLDPEDPGNDVGQFFNDGLAEWQGFVLDLITDVDLSQEQELTLDFYQFDPLVHTVTLKLENGTEGDVEVTLSNSGSGWANGLTFDFSNAILSGDGSGINATGSYSKLVIFIDGGQLTPGTYLIDNINNGSEVMDPNEIDVVYNELVWSDEFDSTTLEAIDGSKWYHQTFGPNGGQWFNGEIQHYTDRIDNSYIENGFLNIVAKSESFTQDGVTLPFTSARLNSKFAFTYGRVDVRAKLPFGNGTWPAIWTLGKNINETGAYWQTQGFGTTTWPACGEIDIMEHGLHATNEVSSAIHTPSSFGNTVNTAIQGLPDVANEFHVYSMNWSPNQITFLIDGVGYYTYNPAVKDANTWPFDLDQYLILNIAMGGFAGPVDSGFTESNMVIDYVRVYQEEALSVVEFNEQTVRLFPNPTSDFLNITSNMSIDHIEIFDVVGKRVFSKSKPSQRIDLSNLSLGLFPT
ncbi:MAG: family 16 glycosylhydrolase [Psychroserpens sp.]|nr:family 16 glycosylhydrolase [Psychroserpens sp.]